MPERTREGPSSRGQTSRGQSSQGGEAPPFTQQNLDEAIKNFIAAHQDNFIHFLNQNRTQPPDNEAAVSSPRRRTHTPSAHVRRTPDAQNTRAHHARTEHREVVRNAARHRQRSLSDDEQDFGLEGFDAYGRIVTPFSDEVLRTPLPDKYKVPSITPYDGLRDPQNFLSQYQYSMINQQLNEIHMCKLFPELLVDNARRWFDSLPPGSIGSYRELMRAFHRRFFQKAETKTTSAHLLTVRQGRGESISDFMTRFIQETLRVENINDLLIISAFQNGILPGALYKEIVKYEPKTAKELWRIADRFAKADEADKRKREADKGEPTDKKRKEENRGDRGRNRRTAFDRLQRGPIVAPQYG